jgi:hypothetical protein
MRCIDMNANLKPKIKNDRKNERGAALITTLLISILLLVVGGALLLTTNMASILAIDSTAELQAYYSAEAGVNAALNVLRGNVESNPAGTIADFRNTLVNDNLGLWLPYNTTINGTSAVSLGNSPVMGYAIDLTDPDSVLAPKQPTRLLVDVVGYGPKGAVKRMEVMVSRYIFDYSAISTILIRGHDNNSTTMGFAVGSSGDKIYSGFDQADPSKGIPVIGVTHTNDFNLATADVAFKTGTVYGSQQVKQFSNSQLPLFLQTADNARTFLNDLQAVAVSQSRYFPASSGAFGSIANPQFTFVDGNCTLTGGAGLLVVTGNLNLSGTPAFNGLVLVLGGGTITRSGGGNGNIFGAFAVARFARTGSSGFLEPSYDTSGGGESTIAFDSSKIDTALTIAPPQVLAIREHNDPPSP